MKQKFIYILSLIIGLQLMSCADWLDRDPSDILTDDQVWKDRNMVIGILANYYNRIPQNAALANNWVDHSVFDDAMWSGSKNYDQQLRNNFVGYNYDWFRLWDYTLIRDINLAIEKSKSAELTDADRKLFEAEFRFIRAQVYFEMVKRMGGVPLITTVYSYDSGTNVEDLQVARSKEHEIYDFVANEVDAIKEDLVANAGSTTRANKYTALALKSRAMLYAASIAKYNSAMPNPITLPGDYVGIPASMATGYYQKSLEASKEIIASTDYALQMPATDSDNFYAAVCDKSNNTEVIWVQDYSSTKFHTFSFENIVRSMREDNLGSSSVTPTLNLVESYDYLDGSEGKLKDKDASGNYIFYTDPADIFANKDARMAGTILYPGSSFKGQALRIQAGVMLYEGGNYTPREGTVLNSTYTDGGLWVGADGPLTEEENVSDTGFYLRKFIDTKSGSSMRSQGSEMWWVYYRMGEIYMNATEAAFELGQTTEALTYINKVRERAGFGANSLSSLTLEKIQKERRNELAFEDHRYFDVKRWRIADKIWNGTRVSDTAMLYGLWPYRVVGGPNDGKYVFVRRVPPRFEQPRWFRMGNYYTAIEQDALNRNPKLVQNPNQ